MICLDVNADVACRIAADALAFLTEEGDEILLRALIADGNHVPNESVMEECARECTQPFGVAPLLD